MPVVQLSPTSSVNDNHKTVPEVLTAPSQSNFTTLFPESKAGSLLKYVEGYPWTVHYYGQILNRANGLDHFDNQIPDLLQPVTEILGMILQVTSPLTASYDEATAVTSVTGAALMPLKVIPNVGDCFVANVDSGEDAIFVVNSVQRKTHRTESLYEINYSLLTYVTADPASVVALKQRVQDTYYFNPDTNYFNRDVLVTPDVKHHTDALKALMASSQEYYFRVFPHWEIGSLLLPGTDETFYDPLLKDFIHKTVDLPPEVGARFFTYTYSDRYIGKHSFFDLLLTRELGLLPMVGKRYGFASTLSLRNHLRFDAIYHTLVKNIVYPISPDRSTDIESVMLQRETPPFVTGYKTARNYSLPSIQIETQLSGSLYTKPLLHELFVNDSYIVSEHFYAYLLDNSTYEQISYFELLLVRFLKGEAITRQDLYMLLKDYQKWSLLHQFYLLPVAWLMVKCNL